MLFQRSFLRHIAVLACVLGAAGLPGASAIAGIPQAPACPTRNYVPNVGLACKTPGGLLQVFSSEGTSLGFTHGADHDFPDDLDSQGGADTAYASEAAPSCVTNPSQERYHVVAVYARAFDDVDRYSSTAEPIRTVIRRSLAALSASAEATESGGATLKVLCAGSQITVKEAVLSTPRAGSDFSTIVSDLTDLGYDNPRLKYWVHFDDRSACDCAGTGNIHTDDQLSVNNANNGNGPDPMFAVTFDRVTSSGAWLHELAHTLGAVQESAPHSTGAGHCTDGYDTMCYNDGGSASGDYTTDACPNTVFDCNNDDYFNATPRPGNYLANNWNLGSTLNRYLVLFDKPEIELIEPTTGSVYRGCPEDPPIVSITGQNDIPSVVFIQDFCVRLEIREVFAQRVEVYIDSALVAISSAFTIDGQVQSITIQGPHASSCCTRTLRVEAVTASGNRALVSKQVFTI